MAYTSYDSNFKGAQLDAAVDKSFVDGYYYFRGSDVHTPILADWRARSDGDLIALERNNGVGWDNHFEFTAASLSISPATASTSPITGALIVTGGVGIGGDVWLGSGLNVQGDASVTGALVQAATEYHYFGDTATDGSWRIGRSGTDLVIERLETGSWVTKQTIVA